MPDTSRAPGRAGPDDTGTVARLALALTAWTERWVPDAFVFALIATVVVVGAGLLATPSTLGQVIDGWGGGFWDLIPFTLQMSLVIITGHVLATSRPMRRLIRGVARLPATPRGAVALVTVFALASSWLNWGFSLVFSAVLAREIARRVEGVDYRALAAASFLGLGSVWAQGLSGSAALQMATPGALQPAIREIVARGGIVPGGIIGFQHTIFLWQSLVSVAGRDRHRHRGDVAGDPAGVSRQDRRGSRDRSRHERGLRSGRARHRHARRVARTLPDPHVDHRRSGAAYLVRYFAAAGEPLNALNLNIVNLIFLLVGFLLHGRRRG